MQLKSIIILSIQKHYKWLWDHYAQSMENQAIRMQSAMEILKMWHNGKSNSVITTIPARQTRQKTKVPHGKYTLHPETQLIEFTQRLVC